MTSTLQRRRDRKSEASPALDDFAAESPNRGTRLPEIALGLLVVAAFGLASLWWFTSATEKVEVIALSQPVGRGDVVQLSDLVVVAINSDDDLATIPRDRPDEVIGRIALSDLPAGTLITPSMFAEQEVLTAGVGIVGLELDAGERPTGRLLPGDTVSVILTPGDNATVELSDGGALELSEVLADRATVVESSPLQSPDVEFVALSMSEDESRAVAVAASLDRVRLIRVAPGD